MTWPARRPAAAVDEARRSARLLGLRRTSDRGVGLMHSSLRLMSGRATGRFSRHPPCASVCFPAGLVGGPAGTMR